MNSVSKTTPVIWQECCLAFQNLLTSRAVYQIGSAKLKRRIFTAFLTLCIMPWLRICGLTNIFIPVPAKIRTVSGRVEGGRSVRSLTHVSRFPQGPVKVLYGRERPSLAGADLVSIVKKHRRSEQSRSVHPVSQPVHVVTRERVSPISTNQRAVRHCVLFEVVS